MYTATPLKPDPTLSVGTNRATLRRSAWWAIPEVDRLQIHAFTRPAQQLRLKVREELHCSLRHSSLYRYLILANKEKGARSTIVGNALQTRLTCNPKEGTTLLKFIYGKLYNGK